MGARTALIACGLVAATALSAAACPTKADLKKGIAFRAQDGTVETHRALRPDWITLQVTYSDGDGSVMEMYRGLYLHSIVPLVSGLPQLGESDSYATTAELQQWGKPQPNSEMVNSTPGGGTAKSGPLKTVAYGACIYDAFEVSITYNDDPGYTETYDYLTELGIGLLTKTVASDGPETYRYISVQTIE